MPEKMEILLVCSSWWWVSDGSLAS